MKARDIAGMRFGRLTAISVAAPYRTKGGGHSQRQWNCICDCGKELVVRAGNLLGGSAKSCGCLGRESCARACVERSTHGLRNHPIYSLWGAMIKRCRDPNDPAYDRYGGRGITVCSGILQSPEVLLRALGERPEGRYPSGRPEWTIDRKDNDGGYWCGACAECLQLKRPRNIWWATAFQQNENSRNARLITIDGQTHCISAWARIAGVSVHIMSKRIKNGTVRASASARR